VINRRAETWGRPIARQQRVYSGYAGSLSCRQVGAATRRSAPRRPRPKTVTGFCQQLEEQRVFSLAGDKPLWFALAKLLLAIAPLLAALQWQLSSTSTSYSRALAESQATHHVLLENRVALDSLRGRLSSPERIRFIAAEKLSLHSPDKDQIEIY